MDVPMMDTAETTAPPPSPVQLDPSSSEAASALTQQHLINHVQMCMWMHNMYINLLHRRCAIETSQQKAQ